MMDAKDAWMVRDLHHAFPFKASAVFCAVLVGLVAWFGPEAKGRSLEEIEPAWNR